jgi:hypothetical protein
VNTWEKWLIVEDNLYWVRILQSWAGMGWGTGSVFIRDGLNYPCKIIHHEDIKDMEFLDEIKRDPEHYIRFVVL